MIVGPGSMIGEEDAISEEKTYTCTATCLSLTGSVYYIEFEDFMTLKAQEGSWMKIIQKSLWKERLKLDTPETMRERESNKQGKTRKRTRT